MSNELQETQEEHLEPPFDSRFSTLCLDPSTVDGGGGGGVSHTTPLPPLCSSCRRHPPRSAATSHKRRSPTPFQHPADTAKKQFLDDEQQQHKPTCSLSKIDLPCSFSPLRRSVSLPTEHLQFSPPLPPPPLRRTISDPNPSPHQNPFKICRVNDSIKDESPDSKRLRRIKNRLKEMNQWWNEVMSEDENRDENDTNKKSEYYNKEEHDEETVEVERVENSLELRLKCPCGKSFEIILNGTNCFYKLL